MKIGIPKETRRNEHRVSLVPRDVAKLVKAGHEVHVEKDAGAIAGFSACAFEKAGATALSSVNDCDLIVGVKDPKIEPLKPGVVIMAYLHVEKGQNARLLAKLKKKKALSYAFEEVRNGTGERLVNLGYEAGLVGITEGLRIWGAIREIHGKRNPFKKLLSSVEYKTKKKIYSVVSQLKTGNRTNIVIMGKGCVSGGVQELLRQTGIKPTVLWRDETVNIKKYLPKVDILVNSVDWYPEDPHIVRKNQLQLMKKTALILDISCDTNGAIESCLPTTWDDPVYETEGVTHFCVSNLPSAIPGDSSRHLSKMILPHVMKVADGGELNSGMMTKKGKFVYQRVL